MKSKNGISELGEPYASMLSSLQNVDGYTEYLQFISKKIVTEYGSIKAEIKAYYELKVNNYLNRISAHEMAGESNPDGLFQIQIDSKPYQGIIEVAYIQYLFDSIDKTKKFINQRLNVNKNAKFENYYPDEGVYISKRQHGTVVGGRNMDLNEKIFKVYETKRKQHKISFPDYPQYIKLYYFLINSPPSILATIDLEKLLERMHTGEIIVMCAVYTAEKQHKQTMTIVTKGLSTDLKLNNKYFAS